jgi:glycosyltransferase involved in cell wall biosynthesis
MKISIIIPAYNEEENIERCIRGIKLTFPYEIIVVNDGSTDRTFEIAKRIKKKNLKVIGYKTNKGKGYAVRFGLKQATGDIIVIHDADSTTPAEEISNIVKPIIVGDADFVNGTRFVYPMETNAMPKIHVLGNKIFAILISLILGVKLTDTLCGSKAFLLRDFKHTRLKENSWPDFELLFNAKKLGLRILEVPIHYKSRKAGTSKMKTFRHGMNLIKILLRNLLNLYF